MPHDRDGQELRVGDTVTMRMRVVHVTQSETARNVTLDPVDVAPSEYAPRITCNARLVALLPEVEPAV